MPDMDLENDVLMHSDKDSDEEELERLVFGDSEGFRDRLKSVGQSTQELLRVGEEDENDEFRGLDDDALFFVDEGPGVPAQSDAQAIQHQTSTPYLDGRQAAWEDSDDERITVSLSSVPRLRKLRVTEGEDLVTGKEYVRRLRIQYERLHPRPAWADVGKQNGTSRKRTAGDSDDEDDGESSDDDLPSSRPLAQLLKDASLFSASDASHPRKKRKLRPEVIDIQRIKGVTGTQHSAITSLHFHPNLSLLLSSGPASTLYLHHINGDPTDPATPHPLLTSLHMRRTPLTTTLFSPAPSDPRIFLSARRKYFHTWDLSTGHVSKISRIYAHQHEQRSMEHMSLSPDGRYLALRGTAKKGGGVVNVLSADTMQWHSQVRVTSEQGVADFAWWTDAKGMTVAGKNGEVSEWSLAEGRVIARWADEGAVGTSVISLGGRSGHEGWLGGDRWVVIGSSTGIVNVYDRGAWRDEANETDMDDNAGVPSRPKPTKVLDHLTTPISHLRFSPDGQLLVMASRWKKDALRLVHLPSCTVYRNWPTADTPLGRVSAVALGEKGVNGELVLAVANEQGKINMWEIKA
ncbi:WD40 repeat-like protein [Eremomyces bilateralis CBS 781.70]|uniref:WD40 repeat-like protein n=1 Tax=Eremomyces bilateralis CBS 781.70 TaxID=1392243 RepID=A0A6G1GF84_9PEZI|nr:WD40 repeat-like protein [Eremomyces bilateralis CBS 781.70]KAF1816713.1 WD40 repeat-like protein [Eremomyces bilateralis CBS 781.70]